MHFRQTSTKLHLYLHHITNHFRREQDRGGVLNIEGRISEQQEQLAQPQLDLASSVAVIVLRRYCTFSDV